MNSADGADPMARLPAEITDVRAPRVLAARRLAKRSLRLRDGRFLAEGPQAVREALARPGTVHELFVTEAAAVRHPELVLSALDAGRPVHRVSEEVADALAQTVQPQGLAAVCRRLDVSLEEVLGTGPRLIAVLARIRDPGNAGTVLRCADAAGADAVLFTDASVDVYNPKCVRSSAGSVFHLPVVVGQDLARLAPTLREDGVRLVAADGSGTDELEATVDAGGLAGPTAWVFGNEAWGLPEETRALTDAVVRVPVYGAAESLNLATAAAICLYASARAQRAPGGCRSTLR